MSQQSARSYRAHKFSKMVRLADQEIARIEGLLVERVTDAVDEKVRGVEAGNDRHDGSFGYVRLTPKDFILVGQLKGLRQVRWV